MGGSRFCAVARWKSLAARSRLCGLGFGRLVGLVLRLEDDPLAKFGEGKFDADLWKGENGLGDQDFVRPNLA